MVSTHSSHHFVNVIIIINFCSKLQYKPPGMCAIGHCRLPMIVTGDPESADWEID